MENNDMESATQQQFEEEVMAELKQIEEAANSFFLQADSFVASQKRKQIEQDIDSGKYEEEYFQFVMDRQFPFKGEDAVIADIEKGIYFDSFCDYLEGKQ